MNSGAMKIVGRYFYMCARPEGKGAHAQCKFFQWVEKKTAGGSSNTAQAPEHDHKKPRKK